jgi:hypothetical protein
MAEVDIICRYVIQSSSHPSSTPLHAIATMILSDKVRRPFVKQWITNVAQRDPLEISN